ncbi:hypothetical protein BU26DRAFT_67874 [Trematosphaeria pertusa]|uniref:Uncharacterized protein n=1 Tax=Trematosphaeria pertusa TaxID=390896 RepID=A0A6A6I614_9PLEO|nr:uncharacterized protein BU26DRAFT_67874 [Trematosphaeria pertusa]KAF2245382.1 hypothetical protein BU26DRAFT_67874 [Trematosphaeria pertusa]
MDGPSGSQNDAAVLKDTTTGPQLFDMNATEHLLPQANHEVLYIDPRKLVLVPDEMQTGTGSTLGLQEEAGLLSENSGMNAPYGRMAVAPAMSLLPRARGHVDQLNFKKRNLPRRGGYPGATTTHCHRVRFECINSQNSRTLQSMFVVGHIMQFSVGQLHTTWTWGSWETSESPVSNASR